jgi:two-component system, OmpR family, phosphate regulon sensor histidine kinase PhoR
MIAVEATAALVIAALGAFSTALAWRLLVVRRRVKRLLGEAATLSRELHETRGRLDARLALGDGIVAFDAERNVRYISSTAALLFAVDAGSIVHLSDVALLRDQAVHEALVRTLHDPSRQEGALAVERGGRVLEVTIAPVEEAGDWAAIALIQDVTDVRRLETMRREFLGNVSHEFRTPLASIKAVLESLDAGGLDDRTIAVEFIGLAEAEVDRLTQLVEELTELGRIESGQVPFRFEASDPRELLEVTVRRMTAQAQRAGITLRVEPGPPLPRIRADRERLGRALVNLVHNALKFTPPDGAVTVSAARNDAGIELRVQDTGAGIAPAEIERIFERFYKADRSRGGQGTGLGLAIVRHTVEAHGGRVSVRSSPGVGSTFTVNLPVVTGSAR